jgi:hypothetical protein
VVELALLGYVHRLNKRRGFQTNDKSKILKYTLLFPSRGALFHGKAIAVSAPESLAFVPSRSYRVEYSRRASMFGLILMRNYNTMSGRTVTAHHDVQEDLKAHREARSRNFTTNRSEAGATAQLARAQKRLSVLESYQMGQDPVFDSLLDRMEVNVW